MAVEVTAVMQCTVVETITGNAPAIGSGNKRLTHDQFNASHSMNASTTVPATKVAAFEQALTDGAATIDLAALVGTNGLAVDATGLKVQAIKVKSKAANANAITLGEGASNGYELLGNAWSITLQPGQEIMLFGNDATPDVGPAAKTIDLTGTGTQSLEVIIVVG